jgi:hypothetical protein
MAKVIKTYLLDHYILWAKVIVYLTPYRINIKACIAALSCLVKLIDYQPFFLLARLQGWRGSKIRWHRGCAIANQRYNTIGLYN